MAADGAPATSIGRRGRLLGSVRRDLGLVAVDGLVAVVASVAAVAVRFDGVVPIEVADAVVRMLPVTVMLHVAALTATRLYGRVWSEAGVPEARALVVAGAASALATGSAAVTLHGRAALPLSVSLLAAILATLGSGAVRFRRRLARTGRAHGPGASRVLLVSSVDTARRLIQEMAQDGFATSRPVAVLDRHPRNWGREIAGVPVLGPLAALGDAAAAHGADQVLLALEDRDGRDVRRAVDRAQAAGLSVRVLPRLAEVVGDRPTLRDVRDIAIDDLLGRPQVETDLAAIAELLGDRRVLITGAGGSIGSEIATQVMAFGPRRLVLLDHDETHLHDVVLRLPPGGVVPVLGDIRDAAAIDELFARERPEVVFHAAAHKHVPILEAFPVEAAHTNVLGTEHLLRAATRVGVSRFVAVSTDKAVRPTSVMGASKRISEQLTVHHQPPQGRYCAVRFGNVLGSRGSVVPTFLDQIRSGGPVTVTHPDMTRFFMSCREAVQLVLQAAVLADGGEVFVLDMGEPVRIVDLAERLIAMSGATPGRDVHIAYVGARPGEKLEEELVGELEVELPTLHPQIRRVRTPVGSAIELCTGVDELRGLVASGAQSETGALIHWLAGRSEMLVAGERPA